MPNPHNKGEIQPLPSPLSVRGIKLANGLCTECCNGVPEPGYRRCFSCRLTQRIRRSKKREQRKYSK